MYESLKKCPVCGDNSFANFLIVKDHAVSQESFAIVACKNCTLKFTNPRPASEHIARYYESSAYISHTSKGNSLLNIGYKTVRRFTLRSKLKIVNNYSQKGKLLDVGCGTGHFLEVCKKGGWTVTGIEPNANARALAKKNINDEVYADLFHLKKKDQYDAITLWHVLEHVENLEETIKHLRKILTPKGRIFIAVPNTNALDAKIYQAHWAAYDVPRHLYHFNITSMKHLFKAHKLKLKKIIPMKLDSFYISMLSEKYKHGSNNYISAFKNAINSNIYAKKNNGEYSSLIYVIKK